jgi:pimeloyl-ACP methyl ester carboxylesterase
VLRDQKELSVIGHSWGGLVAVNIAHQIPQCVKQIVLLSPFCHASSSDPLYSWLIDGVDADWPGVFGNLTREEVLQDLEEISKDNFPLLLAPKLSPTLPIGIVQSLRDETTPASTTKLFCSLLLTPPTYKELDLDHSFTEDRLLLADTVAELLR